MTRFTSVALAAASLFGLLALADDKAPAPMAKIAWLMGGTWTADATAMGNGMQRIETRYQWSDNSAFVRFTTHFVTDKAALRTYDGNFFWNPEKQTLAMWYMDSQNHITEGPVKIDGEVMELLFRGTNFGGEPADLRVLVTRRNNDLYHWALFEKRADAWKELAALDYRRK